MKANKIRAKLAFASLLICGLSACGGATTSVAPTFGALASRSTALTTSEVQPVIDFAEAQEARVVGDSIDTTTNGYHPTRVSAFPSSGDVVFKGFGSIDVVFGASASPSNALHVMGDSRLVVDFSSAEISGRVSNLVGLDGANEIVDVRGDFTFTGGTFNSSASNRVTIDYEIDITADATQLELTGAMNGRFLGTRAEDPDSSRQRVKAIAGFDNSPTIVTGVGVTSAEVSVVGESWVSPD